MQLGFIDEVEYETFEFMKAEPSAVKSWPTEKEPTNLYKFGSIYTEFGQSMKEIERQTYSLLELFGDVGGLFDGFRILFGLVLAPVSAFNMRSMILVNAFR